MQACRRFRLMGHENDRQVYKTHLSRMFSATVQFYNIVQTTIKKQQNELDQLISSATSMSKQHNSKKVQSNIGTVEGIDKEIA